MMLFFTLTLSAHPLSSSKLKEKCLVSNVYVKQESLPLHSLEAGVKASQR